MARPDRDTPAGDAQAGDRHGHPGTPALYAEMLPLVEAGATVKQAARRFGADAEEVEEIAEGFIRWRDGDDADPDAAAGDGARGDAERRVAELEAENRALRRRLADLRDLVQRAQRVVDGA